MQNTTPTPSQFLLSDHFQPWMRPAAFVPAWQTPSTPLLPPLQEPPLPVSAHSPRPFPTVPSSRLRVRRQSGYSGDTPDK
ncbi:MAG: hypothetical protein ACI3YD_00230 [Alloprevotella sp.]